MSEDAYIYFRVAENLAAGHGYVFNVGGEYAETGSSLLWQVLVSLLARLPGGLLIHVKALSLLLSLLCLWITYRIAALFVETPALRVLPPLLLATSAPFAMWSQAGLETPAQTAVVLWFAWSLCGSGAERQLLIAGPLLMLSRPESPLLLLALLPFALVHPERRRLALEAIALSAGVLALVTLWRLFYFHDLVVTAFYVKFLASDATRWEILRDFAIGYNLHWLLAVAVAGLALPRTWSRPLVAFVSLAAVLGFWLLGAYETKPYFRHYALALPFLYVLFALGAEQMLGGRRGRPWLIGAAAVAAVALVGGKPRVLRSLEVMEPNPIHARFRQLLEAPLERSSDRLQKIADPTHRSPFDPRSIGAERIIYHNYQALVGRFLRGTYPPGTTFFYDQMGQTPYFAGADMTFLDGFGLITREVGRFYFAQRVDESPVLRAFDVLEGTLLVAIGAPEPPPMTRSEAVDWVFAQAPDVVMLHKLVVGRRRGSLPQLVFFDPRLEKLYDARYDLGRFVMLYEKKGLAPSQPVVPEGLLFRPPTNWERLKVPPGMRWRSHDKARAARARDEPAAPGE